MGSHIPGDGKERNGPGRKGFVATDDQRATVARMASERLGHPVIAAEIGISVPTLRKFFAGELKERLGDSSLFAAVGYVAPTVPAPRRAKRPGSGGRKRYAANDADRGKVAVLIASGMTSERIALVMKISEPTLRKLFRQEIETGADVKRAEVLFALHRTALKGNVAAQKEAIAIMDRARLEDLQNQVRGKGEAKAEKSDRPDLGKKEQAQLDAHNVVEVSDWSSLVRRPKRS